MADGTYERRGPREAELKRFRRLLAASRALSPGQRTSPSVATPPGQRTSPSVATPSGQRTSPSVELVSPPRDNGRPRPLPTRAIVSLGSNVEPRRETIDRALRALGALPSTRLVKASSVVETEPVDVPAEFRDLKFLNCVAVLETALAPLEFSRRMHAIEDALGRVRTVRNGPRTIDLDLIDFGGLRMATAELTLPHPRGRERAFVTEPLKELGIRL